MQAAARACIDVLAAEERQPAPRGFGVLRAGAHHIVRGTGEPGYAGRRKARDANRKGLRRTAVQRRRPERDATRADQLLEHARMQRGRQRIGSQRCQVHRAAVHQIGHPFQRSNRRRLVEPCLHCGRNQIDAGLLKHGCQHITGAAPIAQQPIHLHLVATFPRQLLCGRQHLVPGPTRRGRSQTSAIPEILVVEQQPHSNRACHTVDRSVVRRCGQRTRVEILRIECGIGVDERLQIAQVGRRIRRQR